MVWEPQAPKGGAQNLKNRLGFLKLFHGSPTRPLKGGVRFEGKQLFFILFYKAQAPPGPPFGFTLLQTRLAHEVGRRVAHLSKIDSLMKIFMSETMFFFSHEPLMNQTAAAHENHNMPDH